MESYPIVLDFSAVDRLSDEQFFMFCASNRNLRIERNADGTINIMSPTGFESSDLTSEVNAELRLWSRKHKLGIATESSGGFTLPDRSVFAPDAAWISNERLHGLSKADRQRFIEACPNFVVEIASPSDNIHSLQKKMRNWLKNGVELGWLIDPKSETVQVYEQGKAVVTVKGFDKVLSGMDVLPGFEMDLSLLKR